MGSGDELELKPVTEESSESDSDEDSDPPVQRPRGRLVRKPQISRFQSPPSQDKSPSVSAVEEDEIGLLFH